MPTYDPATSLITLGGVKLQVDDNGFSIGGASIIELAKPWLGRSKLAGLRGVDDSLGFDVTNITGKRIRVAFSTIHEVPINNDSALPDMYTRILRRQISVSGSTISPVSVSTLYDLYMASQEYWAMEAFIKAKLGDDDITFSKVQELITELNSLSKPLTSLSSPFGAFQVLFAEGDSFKIGAYAIDVATQFSFSLVCDTVVGGA